MITGGPKETTELLKHKFDHIFYTGSGSVGRLVLQAAAPLLTPVTLELGGKCPAILTHGANITKAAKRIAWGKFLNNGQTCLAPDYVLLPEDLLADFEAETKRVLSEFYGEDIKSCPDYGRIINKRHFDRLSKLLASTNGLVIGGATDESDLYMEPTLVSGIKADDVLMKDEIFGPILPLITYSKTDEAIDFANNINDKPLALYIFGPDKKSREKILDNLNSGGVCVGRFLRVLPTRFTIITHISTTRGHGYAHYR